MPKPLDPEIRDLKRILAELKAAVDWDGKDMHEVVAGVNRLIEGDEELQKMGITKTSCLPMTTKSRTRFSVDLYITTPFLQIYHMLSRLVTARRLDSWGEDGPRMTAVPHEGELHVDGVFEALKGLVCHPPFNYRCKLSRQGSRVGSRGRRNENWSEHDLISA